MTGHEGSSYVDIIFKARHTDVLERFRTHATAKLMRIEKLDSKAIRVDVEVLEEHNPRLSDQKERVELTLISRGPKIRAEAAAEDRFSALDMALAKLESRLRRACDRRKDRHGAHAAVRLGDLPEADLASGAELPAIRLGAGGGLLAGHGAVGAMAAMADAADRADAAATEPAEPEDLVAAEEGDSPLIVREKFHSAAAMSLDQALFEMEMVGHDFFLFTDVTVGLPSVVYRRRGYQYGVIRLVEEHAVRPPGGDPSANGQVMSSGQAAASGRAAGGGGAARGGRAAPNGARPAERPAPQPDQPPPPSQPTARSREASARSSRQARRGTQVGHR
jgi:ribosomal subunit interface protein